MKKKKVVDRKKIVKKLLSAFKNNKPIDYFGAKVGIIEVKIFNEQFPGHVLFTFRLPGGNEIKIKLYNWTDKDDVK
jgi:hypothetical protein